MANEAVVNNPGLTWLTSNIMQDAFYRILTPQGKGECRLLKSLDVYRCQMKFSFWVKILWTIYFFFFSFTILNLFGAFRRRFS